MCSMHVVVPCLRMFGAGPVKLAALAFVAWVLAPGFGRSASNVNEVFVGGTLGSASLADGANTTLLRGTGRVGLYIHELGAEMMDRDGVSASVATIFTGRSVAEFGLPSRDGRYNHADTSAFFSQVYPRLFTQYQFHPDSANVNGLAPEGVTQSLADWVDYLSIARANGISTLAPFADPNNGVWPLDFQNPFWDFTKSVCLAVGGLAIDSPPGYFWERSEAYRQHDLAKVVWANSHGLRVSIVISPWGNPVDFLDSTKRFVEYFVDHDVLPTEWIVETYDDPIKPANPGNPIGPEAAAGTVASVALWVAEQAPVAH